MLEIALAPTADALYELERPASPAWYPEDSGCEEEEVMAQSIVPTNVYLEIGKKRTFAGALDWPGWCRSGRDDTAAVQALVDYGGRYARILKASELNFHAPANISALTVVERLNGTMTT